MNMEYQLHSSVELRQLFGRMRVPHQGQDPSKASVLFVGLDANYSAEISDDPIFFRRILEYHEDGVDFWRRHGVHHPFLLPEYPLPRNTGGVPYHRKFASIGLTPAFAAAISFVELLDVPTTGRTNPAAFWSLFNPEHALRLDEVFRSGARRIVLMSDGVMRFMAEARRRSGAFSWLPKHSDWGPVCRHGETTFHKVRHFSSAISLGQLRDIGELVRSASPGVA
jgi:hypothetical protein